MTKTTYILIRESSNESDYTAHSFPTEMAAYTAMNCMIKSHTAAIETTYHIPPVWNRYRATRHSSSSMQLSLSQT